MPIQHFESIEHLEEYEASQQVEGWWSLHDSHPLPAHGLRRSLERAIHRSGSRRGRYGLKAMLFHKVGCPDGLACFVGEDVPMSFIAGEFRVTTAVELDICQIREGYPLSQVLYNALVSDNPEGSPVAEYQDSKTRDLKNRTRDMQEQDLDEAMSVSGARMQFAPGGD